MNSRLTVNTTCPTCGAPLDFSEGSNAVQCGYCNSNLLVTGHRQILSYVISPLLDGEQAGSRVMQVHHEQELPCRVIKSHLFFVPYYHLTGHSLRWQKGAQAAPSLVSKLSETDDVLDPLKRQQITFNDRYVDRNFIACDVQNACPYSLGVRPSVMRLELFRKADLLPRGNVVPLTMPYKDAVRQGLKAVGKQSILYRQVVGLNLSVIYFPYWMVEIEQDDSSSLTNVDAVAGSVVRRAIDTSLLDALRQKSDIRHTTIGFRPLNCPNCGWDLPMRSQDVIFFCDACDRAWEIHRQTLREVPYHFADLNEPSGQSPVTHLPFWVLSQPPSAPDARRYFMPAFRYRRLKLLADVAQRLTDKQPSYGVRQGEKPEAYGCFYDQHDALKFAAFTHVGMRARRSRRVEITPGEKLPLRNVTLTWIPFREQGGYLVDPFTDYHLPRAGLL